ncbi:hypothetical protein DFQ28_004743, partial [Apophysomyces sp. BC1034]
MTAMTFDTLKFANRLKTAGVPSAQAEAEAELFLEAMDARIREALVDVERQQQTLETALKHAHAESESRSDNALVRLEGKVDKGFAELRGELDKRFAEAKGEMLLLKWMLGVVIAGMVSLV